MIHHSREVTLARIIRSAQEHDKLDEQLQSLVTRVPEAVPGCDEVGVVLLRSSTDGVSSPRVAASTVGALEAESLQVQLEEGPALAGRTRLDVDWSDDLAREGRWATWGRTVSDVVGLRAVVSAPIVLRGRRVGALDLYARTAPLPEVSRDVAELVAAVAAALVDHATLVTSLETALDSRTVVAQAQGMLMERYAVNGERAFAYLRRLSQDQNVKLRLLAEDVVEGIDTGPVALLPELDDD